jgi:WD40 repeat protein
VSTLFISHSSTDNELAEQVKRRLARMGHNSVFLDLDPEKGIVAGQSWERTLYRKLRSCRAVVALCTDSYLASHWCFAEIALARMEGKPIFALKADPLGEKSRLPSILREGQYLDLRRGEEDAYGRLGRGLEQIDLLGSSGDWDPKRPPYLGLSYYREEDAPVFFGREAEARGGIELLERGAPNLVMVLGASGSGKSSLVRAGILPALRREPDDWLLVEPMRPGRDPFTELAQALEQSWRRYAPEQASRCGGWQQIRARLEGGSEAPAAPGEQQEGPDDDGDRRVRRLADQLQELRSRPPADVGRPFLEYLDWSLDDLRRVYWGLGEPGPRLDFSTGAGALLELVGELRHAAGHSDARVVLVVDQFEEALGGGEREERCRHFLSLLREALEADHAPLVCLGTMRSDFLPAFQRNASLRGIDFESLSLGPMRIEGMRRVIEEPARLAALELEQGLADRLLADAETPDALPLLSFTLWVMWRDHRQDGTLSFEEYEHLGGLEGAMVREADAVLADARRDDREDDLRRAFIRMARLTEDGQYARRTVSWDTEEIARVRPILERLVERRLLVSRTEGERGVVEVAHESLFRAWGPCRDWLDNNRSELLLRQQLTRDAKAWEQGGRSADLLWRGGRLRLAQELVSGGARRGGIVKLRRGDVGVEQRFVHESARRRVARIRLVATAIGVAFLTVLGLWLRTVSAKREVNEVKARSQDLVRLAVSEDLLSSDPTFSGLVLLEVERPGETGFSLSSAVLGEGFAEQVLHHDGEVIDAKYDRSGDRIVTTATDFTVSLWDARNGRLLHRLAAATPRASFSPDGRSVVTTDELGVKIWSVESGAVVRKLGEELGAAQYVLAAFDPGGSRVVEARRGAARIWDVVKGKPLALSGSQELSHPYHVEFSPDGSLVVVATQRGWYLWDATGGERRHEGTTRNPVLHATFDGASRHLVTSSRPGARVWDVVSGEELGHFGKHAGVQMAGFSPDGARLVTAGDNGKARIWDVATAEEIHELAHGDETVQVNSARFDASGAFVLTAASDGVARVFDADNKKLRASVTHQQELTTAVWGPDGRFVTASLDDTARIWNPMRGARLHRLDHGDPAEEESTITVAASAFAGDGKLVVTVTPGAVRVWDVGSGNVVHRIDAKRDESGMLLHFESVRVSPDGGRMVTASQDGTVRILDVATGGELQRLVHPDAVHSASFGPAGERVLTSAGNRVRLWNVAVGLGDDLVTSTDDALFELEHPGKVSGASFGPSGDRILTYSDNDEAARQDVEPAAGVQPPRYEARIWNATNGELLRQLPHPAEPDFAAFTPDGRQVVTTTNTGWIFVWNAASGKQVRAWDAHPPDGDYLAQALSPDGRHLVTSEKGGISRVWDIGDGDDVAGLRVAGDYGAFALLFDSAGDRLAVGSMSGSVQVWETRDWRHLYTLAGHEGWVWTLGFSPDERLLVSGAMDSTARIWPLTIDGLTRIIRDQSGACLSVEYRVTELAESAQRAKERYRACEIEHGRPGTLPDDDDAETPGE